MGLGLDVPDLKEGILTLGPVPLCTVTSLKLDCHWNSETHTALRTQSTYEILQHAIVVLADP